MNVVEVSVIGPDYERNGSPLIAATLPERVRWPKAPSFLYYNYARMAWASWKRTCTGEYSHWEKNASKAPPPFPCWTHPTPQWIAPWGWEWLKQAGAGPPPTRQSKTWSRWVRLKGWLLDWNFWWMVSKNVQSPEIVGAVRDSGMCQSIMAWILTGSILIPSADTTDPKNVTDMAWNVHFSAFTKRWSSKRHCNTQQTCWTCTWRDGEKK